MECSSSEFECAYSMSLIQDHRWTVRTDDAMQWNGGWPQGNNDISFSNDQTWISETNGKGYVAPASPWFYAVRFTIRLSSISLLCLRRCALVSITAQTRTTRTSSIDRIIGCGLRAGNSSSRIGSRWLWSKLVRAPTILYISISRKLICLRALVCSNLE